MIADGGAFAKGCHALVCGQFSDDDLKQGGFARAVDAHNGGLFMFLQVEGYLL